MDTNIYEELSEMEMLKDRIRENQDTILDIYDKESEQVEMMDKLLKEMNDLLEEVDDINLQMQDLMKQL